MIEELHIRDLALIDEVWLEFGPGLTVLTGETGAGKTVLLSALKLLMGERADSGAVRYGADDALVEARLSRGADGVGEADEMVVSRRVSSGGRSRCTVNGAMATVTNLEEAVGPLVDLHGQHEHQSLLRSATHVNYLDSFGGDNVRHALDAYLAARESHLVAVAEVASTESALTKSAEEIEVNRLILAEIDRVDPRANEDEELQSAVPALQHAEEIASAIAVARGLLTEERGASDTVGEAIAALRKVAPHLESIQQLVDQLDGALSSIDDAASSLRSAASAVAFDGDELDRVLSRLAALDGLKKRFGPTLAVVLERREALEAASEVVALGDEALEQVRREAERTRLVLLDRGSELEASRRDAARRFREAVLTQMAGLELGSVDFEVAIDPLPFDRWSAVGPVAVEFMYSPAAGVPPRPLAKIASGGEISRVMLAIKSVLGTDDPAETLVFDEVDAGIGGAAATAVGERLARLGATKQVIVVTHLAQVAALADAHYVVRKVEEGGVTSTVVVPVEGEGRVREVARMLSGNLSDAALEHAKALLAR